MGEEGAMRYTTYAASVRTRLLRTCALAQMRALLTQTYTHSTHTDTQKQTHTLSMPIPERSSLRQRCPQWPFSKHARVSCAAYTTLKYQLFPPVHVSE